VSPTFIHLNGPACVGKSTLARRFVERRPLALCVDVDALRASLGGWINEPESKGQARALAADMTAGHLRRGFDVVMPQLTVLGNLIDEYASIAADAGASFVEIVLIADPDELVARLPAPDRDAPHPRDAFSPAELRGQMEYALRDLSEIAAARDFAHVLDVGGLSVGASLEALEAFITSKGL
jgi:predicted kinase